MTSHAMFGDLQSAMPPEVEGHSHQWKRDNVREALACSGKLSAVGNLFWGGNPLLNLTAAAELLCWKEAAILVFECESPNLPQSPNPRNCFLNSVYYSVPSLACAFHEVLRLRDSVFQAPHQLSHCSTIVFAVEEPPADEWIPGESFTCVSGNEIRQALLLAIWRDIQNVEPMSVLEKWKEAACTWPLLLKVVDKRSMLTECASLHHRRAAEAVEYTAPHQLQLLWHCVAQKRAESPQATVEVLHMHCRRLDSVRRPGA